MLDPIQTAHSKCILDPVCIPDIIVIVVMYVLPQPVGLRMQSVCASQQPKVMDLSSPRGVCMQILHLHSRNQLAERQACGLWPGQHLSLPFCALLLVKSSHMHFVHRLSTLILLPLSG